MYSAVPGLALSACPFLWAVSGPCTALPRALMGRILAAPPGPRQGAAEVEQRVGLASPCLPIQPAFSVWPALPTSSEEIVTEEFHMTKGL